MRVLPYTVPMSEHEPLHAYHEATEHARDARRELDAALKLFRGFLEDLDSAAHHLSFHGDGSYTRGEACTIHIENVPDFDAVIAARQRWETARNRERELHGKLTAAQRVALTS